MPEVFHLPSLISKTINGKPIPKAHKPTPKQYHTPSLRLKIFLKQYSTRVWSGYYIALIFASFMTGFIVERSDLARNIMNAVRQDQTHETTQTLTPHDNSSFNITTSTGMVAYVIYPTGERVGDTAEGIRYLEIRDVFLSRTDSGTSSANFRSTTSWGMLAKKPPNGQYLVDFSSRRAGTYTYTLSTYDQSGYEKNTFSDQISLSSFEHYRYILSFNKQDPDTVRFIFFETIFPE